MNSFTSSLRRVLPLICGLLIATGAHAACEFPANIEVPDGSTATEAEMVAAQSAVKEYMAKVEDYLTCLAAEASDLGMDITEDDMRIRDMRHNAAVDEMEKLAAEFNAQIRAFKKNQ
jgi:hypothetical protein